MFTGMAVTSMKTALIAHAIGAQVIYAVISWILYTRLGYSEPLLSAALF